MGLFDDSRSNTNDVSRAIAGASGAPGDYAGQPEAGRARIPPSKSDRYSRTAIYLMAAAGLLIEATDGGISVRELRPRHVTPCYDPGACCSK